MMKSKKLYRVKTKDIENFSGVNINLVHGKIRPLKRGYYKVLDFSVGGDAPKEFIQAYRYGDCPKRDRENWSKFIAKVGHKWYPVESITEYLMNRIGEVLELKMAESELRVADEQIRFLSRYFLKEDEMMMHGAQIYSTFLDESDTKFVDQIEEERLSRDFFTFNFTKKAIEAIFPAESVEIMESFIKLLLFDTLTGNNDRHFYNWAVVTDLLQKQKPVFSPIYDTARGLFWNFSEEKISELTKEFKAGDHRRFEKYINGSQPKIGWEKAPKKFNHFDLIKNIVNNHPDYAVIIREFITEKKIEDVNFMIRKEFNTLLSENRLYLVTKCLRTRFEKLKDL